MTRALRWLLSFLVILAVFVVVVLVGLRFYLTSDAIAGQAAEQLSTALRAPVRVRTTDIGLTGSSLLKDVRLYESEKAEQPWAEVEEVVANVSALDLAGGGAAPTQLTLRRASVELRFTRDGTLLTRPPLFGTAPNGEAPRVRLENSRLTLRQEGREPMVLDGIDAIAEPTDGGLRLQGSISDAQWGKWQLEGTVAESGQVSLHLTTPRTTVTQKQLETVPFVPPEVWDQVHVEGTTGADVTLRFGGAGKDIHYRVALDVLRAGLKVTTIGMDAADTAGKVVIADALITLNDVTGEVAGGKLAVPSGELDFRKTPTRMTFAFKGRDLDPRKLPATWQSGGRLTELLETFDSEPRLNGHANLTVLVSDDGKVQTSGGGEAELTGVKLAGKEAKITLKLDLDNRVRFSAAPQTLPLLITAVHADIPEAETPGYVELNLGLQGVDLAELLNELKLDLPLQVGGKLSFQVKAALPLATPRDLKTYRVEGTATLPTLQLEGVTLHSVEAKFHYAAGVLHLDRLAGQVPVPDGGRAGRFNGTVRWGLLVEDGELVADLKLESAPLAAVRSLLPGPVGTAGGTISGSFRAQAPSARLSDPAAWNVTASLRSDAVRLYGLHLEKLATDLKVEAGVAHLTKLSGMLEGATVTGSGELRLEEPYSYRATLEIGEADLAVLSRLSPELRPSVDVRGKVSATAIAVGKLGEQPRLTGSAKASDLVVEGVAVEQASGKWSLGDGVLRIGELNAKLYDGQLEGTATVPVASARTGGASLEFTDLNAAALARSVPQLPLKVEGKLTGKLRLELPPAVAGKSLDVAADLSLTEGRLRIQNIPTRKLQGAVQYRGGALHYELQGDTLGGKFHLDGQVPAAEGKTQSKPEQSHGRLRVQHVQLAQLWDALHLPALAPLTGRFDIDIPFAVGHDGKLAGHGRFILTRVRLSDRSLAEDLRGDIVLEEDVVDFRDVSGAVAGGLARVRVRYNLGQPERSFFTVALERAESSVLLRPLQGDSGHVRGPANVHLRGRLGNQWSGRGDVTLVNGEVFGIDVSEWRLPVDFVFTPVRGRGEVVVADSHGEVGRGRVTGRVTLRWGETNRLEGVLHFRRVEIGEFLGSERSLFGSGRASGRFDFQANELRSVNDLAGILEASLDDTQALRMPVLRELVRYVAPGRGGTQFESGDIRGRLGNGVFRLERLTLTSFALQIFVHGTVTLAGRLNLEATARAGNLGANSLPLRLLGLRMLPVGPIPLGVLIEVSNYLSSRAVQLQISGTIHSPIVRVNPIRLLAEEAVRYFLTRALIPVP